MEYKPKSKYIKDKIKACSFNNRAERERVFDLIALEKLFINGCANSGDAMFSQTLHARYPKEFDIIFKEVNSTDYKKYLKKQKARARNIKDESAKWEKVQLKEEQKQKHLWLELGGIA